MRAAFIAGHPRPTYSRRDRVGNSGKARTSRRGGQRRRVLPALEQLVKPDAQV